MGVSMVFGDLDYEDVLERLALLRMTVGVVVVLTLLFGPYGDFNDTAFRILHPSLSSGETMMVSGGRGVMRMMAIVAGTCVAIGWHTEATAVAVFVMYGVLNGWVAHLAPIMWNYNTHLLWFVLGIALTPSAAVYSVDAMRQRNGPIARDRRRSSAIVLVSMQLFVGVIYFQAGLAKLVAVGPSWYTTGRTLEVSLIRQGSAAGLWLAQFPLIVRKLSLMTGAFELSFLPLLMFKRLHAILAAVAIVFHLSCYVLLGISFWQLWLLYLPLFGPYGCAKRIRRARGRAMMAILSR